MRFSMWSGLLCLLAVVMLAGSLFIGCGGDDGGGEPDLIVLADFEGSWAAASYKVTSAANSQVYVELIAVGGAFAWDADDKGEFVGRGFIPAALAGESLEMPFQGSFELVSQESVAVSFTPEYPPFLTETRASFTLEGNTFTIRDENTMFDFGGGPEPAIFTGMMVRHPGGAPPVFFLEDFEGHWEASVYRVTSVADPLRTVEIISLEATFEMDTDDGGAFVGEAFIPAAIAGEDITISGFTGIHSLATQDTMVTTFTPEYPPFLTDTRSLFTLAGNTLNITDENAMFDFGQGHGVEPAIFEGTMERTTP